MNARRVIMHPGFSIALVERNESTWVRGNGVLDALKQAADDQPVCWYELIMEFRRFQLDLREPIELDYPSRMVGFIVFGEEQGRKILNHEVDKP